MIIDFHTHIFPPEMREHRDAYLRRDPTFAEMYASPRAKIATAEDLLASMEASGVDISVALGFAWREQELIERHNDYLLESAAKSDGRIIAFATVNPAAEGWQREVQRCAAAGAKGLGELRPESQGWDLNGEPGQCLAKLATTNDLILLFHVTEPTDGREYAGKGGLTLDSFYRFSSAHPQLKTVGAHLGGGLPFFLPREDLANVCHVFIDTAARRWLYTVDRYREVFNLVSPQRVLLGSDFPLVAQDKEIEMARADSTDKSQAELVLGQNARRLLRISPL